MTTTGASNRQVVITGLGIVSPIGVGLEAFSANLQARRSGIDVVQLYQGLASPDNVGAEVKEFTDESAKKVHLKDVRKSIKLMCREIQLGVAAALQAIGHGKLTDGSVNHERLGVEFGANLMLSPPDALSSACTASCTDDKTEFDGERWGQQGLPSLEPLWLLKYLPNMPACHVGIAADARGPNNSLTLDDASGNTAIAEACRIVQRGSADVMITGTTGTSLHPMRTMHLALWPDFLATGPHQPAERSRPFDRHRTGMVVGEGAATLILEERAHAEKRGMAPFGLIKGFGSACVVDKHGVADFRKALAGAMRAALKDAGMSASQIGHINAHGLGWKQVDIEESRAIHDVFGDLASKVPVTACKSFLGNSGAAAGMLELISSLLALRQGVIPMTLNYDEPDPDCQPLNIVSGEPMATSNRVFLKVNVTRKGQASAVVVEAL